jgi:hypothetical protein
MRLGEHRNVTEAQLDGCGAHALRNETVQFGLDGAIFGSHNVPTRLGPPGDELLLCLGQIACETTNAVRLYQIRPSATSMWEKTSVTGNFCYWLCEVSASSGASAAM